ncbi:MAG TPA: tetratricopeptide repeat protein [Chthonomonadaceae bacterium]|nr:tetratricopeptide repeat protein [Chthonomonadaceae bacterium]
MYCTACGTRNQADSNYCRECGQKLEKAVSPKIREEDYERALPEDEQVSALLERAYRARSGGDMAAAIALCEEALRLRPESTSAHSLLARLFEQSGLREDAIRELEAVLRLNPGSIADRVKLDELRDGRAPARHQIVSPNVALLDSRRGPIGPHWSAMVGVAALAIALGGLYALLGRSHPTVVRISPAPVVPAANANPAVGVAQSDGKNDTSSKPPAAAEKAEANAPNSLAYYFPPPYYASPLLAPTRVSGRAQRETAEAPRPALGIRHLAAIHANPVSRPTGASRGGAHILLPGEGGADDSQPYIIRVTDEGSKGRGGTDAAATGPAKGSSAKEGENNPPPVIKISQGPAGNDGGATRPVSGESHSLMAMAADLKLKGNYNAAIDAYRRALPTAGDDSGLIYQQIAVCYQQKGDKHSAIANYQSAINEYQKLIDGGRRTDRARDGIRVCERGIKLCGSE